MSDTETTRRRIRKLAWPDVGYDDEYPDTNQSAELLMQNFPKDADIILEEAIRVQDENS